MPKPISIDLRRRIVAHAEAGYSLRSTARHFSVSPSCVVNLMQRWNREGTLEARPTGRSKGEGKLTPYRDFLLSRVREQPDITLPELADVLLESHHIEVTPSGLSRFMTREGVTYKKNSGRHGTLPT